MDDNFGSPFDLGSASGLDVIDKLQLLFRAILPEIAVVRLSFGSVLGVWFRLEGCKKNTIGTSKHTDDDDDDDDDDAADDDDDDDDDSDDDADDDDDDDGDDDDDDDDDDDNDNDSSANVAIYIIYVYIATEEVATLLTNLCHNVVSWSVMLRQKHGICWRKMNLTRAVQD